MATLKTLVITNKVTEAVRIDSESCAIMVTTTEASTVTVERSVDGNVFAIIPNVSLVVNGSDGLNLTDIVPGQWLRVTSTGAITLCKILF
jgi:hypothetical protein